MDNKIQKELSSNGILRAAINMSNFLLVTDKTKDGTPIGVSPDMAKELANKLNLQLKLIPYNTPGEIADTAENNEWDICNIGAEPQRAEKINFSAAYAEIQATYLIPPNSKLQNISEVDKTGNKIYTLEDKHTLMHSVDPEIVARVAQQILEVIPVEDWEKKNP